jgi:hypothetical protein
MAMLRVCATVGCDTKTLGLYCIDHEGDAADDLNAALKSAVERRVDQAESSGEPTRLDHRN